MACCCWKQNQKNHQRKLQDRHERWQHETNLMQARQGPLDGNYASDSSVDPYRYRKRRTRSMDYDEYRHEHDYDRQNYGRRLRSRSMPPSRRYEEDYYDWDWHAPEARSPEMSGPQVTMSWQSRAPARTQPISAGHHQHQYRSQVSRKSTARGQQPYSRAEQHGEQAAFLSYRNDMRARRASSIPPHLQGQLVAGGGGGHRVPQVMPSSGPSKAVGAGNSYRGFTPVVSNTPMAPQIVPSVRV